MLSKSDRAHTLAAPRTRYIPAVLIVQRSCPVRPAIYDALYDGGYRTTWVDLATAVSRIETRPDIILCHITSFDSDVREMMRSLQSAFGPTPIIGLLEGHDDSTRVEVLEAGACDVMTPPISILELKARIRIHVNSFATEAISAIQFGGVRLDLHAGTVHRAGQEVHLSRREFQLLEVLVLAQGALISRQDLLASIWGHRIPLNTRTLDYHIQQLRNKLEPNPREPRFIRTVRRRGYRFQGEPPVEDVRNPDLT